MLLAGGQGFGPRFAASKADVLPLDDPPNLLISPFYHGFHSYCNPIVRCVDNYM